MGSMFKNILKKFLLLSSILTFPSLVLGGWFTNFFGIEGAASAIADASWKIILTKALQTSLPIITILTLVVLILVASSYISKMVIEMAETLKSAIRDGEVKRSEWIIIGIQFTMTLPVIIFIAVIIFYSGQFVIGGMTEIMNFIP